MSLFDRAPRHYLEIFHADRVDDGTEQKLEDDQRVDGDSDSDGLCRVRVVGRQNAVLAHGDEPDDDRHPTEDARADDQQSRDDGLCAGISVRQFFSMSLFRTWSNRTEIAVDAPFPGRPTLRSRRSWRGVP